MDALLLNLIPQRSHRPGALSCSLRNANSSGSARLVDGLALENVGDAEARGGQLELLINNEQDSLRIPGRDGPEQQEGCGLLVMPHPLHRQGIPQPRSQRPPPRIVRRQLLEVEIDGQPRLQRPD